MPLSSEQALTKLSKVFPERSIEGPVEFKNLWIFKAIDSSDPVEGSYDPFFSVDKTSGIVREFSVMTDATPFEIFMLFKNLGKT